MRWQLELYRSCSTRRIAALAEIAAKALKETRYHFRYSAGWLVRLGDGTEESHQRVQNALDELWHFTRSSSRPTCSMKRWPDGAWRPDLTELRPRWLARIDAVLKEATLTRPADVSYPWHGKRGQHSEHLGYLLAEMQFLQRTYPGSQW